jgi:hypothetical protein
MSWMKSDIFLLNIQLAMLLDKREGITRSK